MGKGPQVIAALAATVGAFGLGTLLGWTSPGIPNLDETANSTFNKLGVLSESDKSWIGSIIALGSMLSGPIAGICIDAIGRKNSMLLLSAPFVLGWLLCAFAQNVAMMLIGRFIIGFCGGSFSLAAPVFIGETAEDSIRGALGSGFQLMCVNGILFVYVVGAFVNWQWLSVICGVVPLVLLAAMIFIPESPRYLLMKGKNAEASKALCWLRGATSSQEVEDELRIVEMSVNESLNTKTSFNDLLLPYNLKPTLILLGLMLFQQLSGINAVIFYTVEIFEDAGSDMDSNLSAIIIGIVQVVATFAAVMFVDRAGRRILLLLSDVVMCVSLVLLGIFFQLKENDGSVTESLGWLPLISLILFIVAFSVGYGPIPWMMTGELLPPNIKSLGASIATAFNWFLAFLVTKFFADVKSALTIQWCYWIFAIICAVGTVFVFLLVPETKGKSMEEIQQAFGAPVSTYNHSEDKKEKS